jgi:hypothetical protein
VRAHGAYHSKRLASQTGQLQYLIDEAAADPIHKPNLLDHIKTNFGIIRDIDA